MSEYTKAQCAVLENAQPLDLAKADALASELGKTRNSIIAKAKQLGLDYRSKKPAAKRPKGVTKATLAADIGAALNLDLSSLEKATLADLQALKNAITK